MDQDTLNHAFARAEQMVGPVKEARMRAAAFGVVLSILLDGAKRSTKTSRAEGRPPARSRRGGGGDTAPARIIGLKGIGFFKEQRSLSEVRDELGASGWHYALTALSGVMQGLVQARELRRVRAKAGNRHVWKYSNY
jgi:hypothetical protein